MSVDPLPADVTAFLVENVRSLRALELLLLLQVDPSRAWTAAELSAELRATPEWAAQELELLMARGLLTRGLPESNQYRFAPRTTELEDLVARISALYPERRFSIIQAIFSAPSESVRRFADAFRLRKENPDG